MEKKKQSTAAPGRITGAYLHGLGRHVRLVSGAGRALFGRYLTLLLLVLAGLNHAAAQGHKYYVYLPDESIIMDVIPNGSTVTPLFTDPAIDMLFEGHTVYAFHKAFPTSEAGAMRKVYLLECEDPLLTQALHNYNGDLFPYFEEIPGPFETGSYTPDDLGLNYDDYFLQINAPGGWYHTQGDSSVHIGITDTYFDLSHPDMVNKYARVRQNILGGIPFHGVLVAGIAGAATDNNTGFPSVGFNCGLDVSNNWGSDNEMLLMSQDSVRIINASWLHYATDNLVLPFVMQGLYNEVYENGTIAIFGAGNGRPGVEGNSRRFVYPASLDHNISVSNVGWENDSTGGSPFNGKWVHETNAGDSVNTYQHNTRVDILAPSIRIGGHDFDPNDPTKHYQHAGGWGTSFAAPMVSGACGLMLSVKPWLTPYMMEWFLKESAVDVRGVSWNQKYAGPTKHRGGRMGSGALNVGAALDMINVDNLDVYDPAIRTFVVRGIDLNTRCVPDSSDPTRPVPILKVVLADGLPPYTYKWEPYPDNKAVLDLTKPGQPRVVASSGNHLLHYRLTVYDNSPIQKVANKDIEIPLLTDLNAWDLMMRDAYADMGKERNNMDSVNANDWNIWESPDVWNRVLADGGLEHEDPVHSQYAPNHLYVRVKNIGCAPSPAQGDSIWLNLYWTIASTGETWPIDWVGGSAINGHPAGQHIGMVPVSSLQPGKDTILWHDWQPPLPQDYDSTVTDIEVCVLARIETSPVPDFGMAFPEVPVTKENVWNNNNIVTRNLVVYDFSSGQKIVNSTIGVGNSGPTPTVFTVQIATGQHLQPNLHGHPADFLTATLELGGLYDLWVAGGRQGNVSSYNDEAKSVTYDLERPIRLEHIELGPLERHMIHVKLTMKDNVVVPEHVNSDRLFIRQLIEHQEMVEGPNGPTEVKYDEVYGTVAFAIRISPTEGEARERRAQTQQQIEETQLFRLYPNPSDNQFMIESLSGHRKVSSLTVSDVTGKVVLAEYNISLESPHAVNTSRLSPGSYFVRLVDTSGKGHFLRFVKLD